MIELNYISAISFYRSKNLNKWESYLIRLERMENP